MALLGTNLVFASDGDSNYVTQFYFETKQIELKVGETISLDEIVYVIEPLELQNEVEIKWDVADYSVVNMYTLDNETYIEGLRAGETELYGFIGVSELDSLLDRPGVCVDGRCYDVVKIVVVEDLEEPEDPKYITSIEILWSGKELSVGESYVLPIRYEPNDATELDLEWSSSNENVIKVDNVGHIEAVGKGIAAVTVRSLNAMDTVILKVVDEIEVEDIIVYDNNIELYEGQRTYIGYRIVPEDATNKEVVCESSSNSIVSVDRNTCRIEARNVGEATIKISTADGKVEKEINVVVKGIPNNDEDDLEDRVNRIYFRDREITLVEGDTYELELFTSPYDIPLDRVTWRSNRTTVAKVDDKGVVEALSPGRTIITASVTDKLYAQVEVYVEKLVKKPEDIDLEIADLVNGVVDDEIEMEVGEKKKINVSFYPEDSTEKGLRWSTSDKSIVDVNNRGEFVAKSPGIAYINVESVSSKITKSILVRVKYNEDYWDTVLKGKALSDRDFIVKFSVPINSKYNDHIFLSTDSTGNSKEDLSPAVIQGNTVIFRAPSDGWKKGTEYYIFITKGIKSIYGDEINKSLRYVFTVID